MTDLVIRDTGCRARRESVEVRRKCVNFSENSPGHSMHLLAHFVSSDEAPGTEWTLLACRPCFLPNAWVSFFRLSLPYTVLQQAFPVSTTEKL